MKSIQKKKKLIFFAYEKLCSSKISTGFLLTIVRRSIRGSDFRLSPISRSNHPGFYRVITPSYLADIFFFPPPLPPFSTRRAEAQSTQLSPAGRRDLAIDLFFRDLQTFETSDLALSPLFIARIIPHRRREGVRNEVSEIRD